MKILQMLIIISSLLLSCSSKVSKNDELSKKIFPKVNPIIHLINSDSIYILNFTFACNCNDQEKINYLNSINTIEIDLIDTNDEIFQSLKINDLKHLGIQNDFSNSKYILFGKIDFTLNKKLSGKFSKLNYSIGPNKSKVSIFKQVKNILVKDEDNVLDLYPIIKNKNKSSIEFGIFVVRNKIIDEYIPNSETLRLEIINSHGKGIWNSGYGGNFMQVIYPVFPEKVGASHIYSNIWLLKKNKGSKALPGNYKANLLIPALPKPYFTSIDFTLKANDNDK